MSVPVLSSLRGRGAPAGNLLMAVRRVRRRSVLGLAANMDQPQQKTESENGGKTSPKSMCDFMIHHFPTFSPVNCHFRSFRFSIIQRGEDMPTQSNSTFWEYRAPSGQKQTKSASGLQCLGFPNIIRIMTQ